MRAARALEALPPSPEHMFFFEYNFLYVLAAGGRPDKTALGDHSPAGYAQRARFYAISQEARLNFAKAIAHYIVFLAATTGWSKRNRCATAAARLDRYTSLEEMLVGDLTPYMIDDERGTRRTPSASCRTASTSGPSCSPGADPSSLSC